MFLTQTTGEIRTKFDCYGTKYMASYVGPMCFAESNGIVATGFTEYEAHKKLETILNSKKACDRKP